MFVACASSNLKVFNSTRTCSCVLGLGPIHMNEVLCTGREKSITECKFKEASIAGCQHEEDVAVRCNVAQMGYSDQVSLLYRWP